MPDIKSKRLIVFKGLLFAVALLFSAALLFADSQSLRTALLLAILIWSTARLYYFLFYVLHTYVDPNLKYSGVWKLLTVIVRGRAP